jgi:predicted permease
MVSFLMLCGWGIGFRFLVPSFMKLKERERERERERWVCVCVPVSVIGNSLTVPINRRKELFLGV